MAWCIYKMQQIVFSFVVVQHVTCLGFYGNASFALNVEFVEDLLVPTGLDCPSELQETVAQRGLAMIDMRNYTEVAKSFDWNRSDAFLEVRLLFQGLYRVQ